MYKLTIYYIIIITYVVNSELERLICGIVFLDIMAREIQSFDIRFKDSMGSFRAGDDVAGVVHLVLLHDLKLKGWFNII